MLVRIRRFLHVLQKLAIVLTITLALQEALEDS